MGSVLAGQVLSQSVASQIGSGVSQVHKLAVHRKMLSLLLLIIFPALATCTLPAGKLFKRTPEIAEQYFLKKMTMTSTVSRHLECTLLCAKNPDDCNAYNVTGTECRLARLAVLPEPKPDWPSLSLMIPVDSRLRWTCRGGDDCCSRTGKPGACSQDEGSCSRDSDCRPWLMCGAPGN